MHFTNAHDQLKLYVDLFTYVVRIFVLLNTVGLRLNSAVRGRGFQSPLQLLRDNEVNN